MRVLPRFCENGLLARIVNQTMFGPKDEDKVNVR